MSATMTRALPISGRGVKPRASPQPDLAVISSSLDFRCRTRCTTAGARSSS